MLNEYEREKIKLALYHLGVETDEIRNGIADWFIKEYGVGTLLDVEEPEPNKCAYCGANVKKYWHRITPALVDALIKLKRSVIDKGENKVHLLKDFHGQNELTRHEWNNFTKLRYHGLAVKYKDDDGNHKGGYWLLTRRGSQFLRGEIEIPERVQTFRNRITDKSEVFVKVGDVVGSVPYIETIDDIDYELADAQQSLFRL